MLVEPFDSGASQEWDEFVDALPHTTFLHTRRFLSYHGDRFLDRSILLRDNEETLLGVLPAAVDPDDESSVVSHPGATFGGLLVREGVGVTQVQELFQKMREHLCGLGYRTLIYKPTPAIYHQHPTSTDTYCLFRLGARRMRCGLSATIDLQSRGPVRKRRERDLRARASNARIEHGNRWLQDLWPLLTENRKERHGVTPTHSKDEIVELSERFPREIACSVALVEDELQAGAVLFKSPRVAHLQYMANSERGRESHALDVLVEHLIKEASAAGLRFFDFGISTEGDGTILNEGLHLYKTSFGAGTTVYETYELPLDETSRKDA